MKTPIIFAVAALFAATTTHAADPIAGRSVYAEKCASCHGQELEGISAPPLGGMGFLARWPGKAADLLYREIAEKMPPTEAGKLPKKHYEDVFAYILAQNSYQVSGKVIAPAPPAPPPPPPKVPDVMPAPPTYYGAATEAGPVTADLAKGTSAGGWPMYNGDYRGHRYSPLKQITAANAGKLAPKCMFQTGEIGAFQVSPVLYRERLYITTARNTYALDAVSCKKIWTHQRSPEGPEGMTVNRGVAIYDGRVIRGTPDGHLIALDSATGKLLWDVWVTDTSKGSTLSAAPVAFDGKVFIGEGGADRGATGHIHAFDIASGKPLWTFHPVPTGNQPGAETWGKGGQQYGGGSSWSTIHVDPATRRLYVPIGNPGSSLEGSVRPGDNLYTNSIVVLDADTGKLDWYIQQVPHDVWDWDTAAAPVPYDIKGKSLLAIASKDGWLYLHDRATKKLIAKQEISSHLNTDVKPHAQGVRVCPGTLGGAEWFGPAIDAESNMLFIGTVDWCATLFAQTNHRTPFGGSLRLDPVDQAKGWLRAFDATTGAPKWVHKSATPVVAGVTPTAGGVVFTGNLDGEFLAFASKTGDVLYRFNIGGAIGGGVSTYEIGGKQYVAVAAGNASKTIWSTTGAATVVIFGLP
ncbi:MAG: PQQ-binding-like beta-propeller repeat protein [Rhodospirillaceae bacterium]|nr:PQQ-binding-like beta-propeller repeat protein [Rhodospirillaceae bacterium]